MCRRWACVERFRTVTQLLMLFAWLNCRDMTSKLTIMGAVVLGGVMVAGTLSSCDDDNDNNVTTGVAGRGGTTGAGGFGGTSTGGAGGINATTFTMQMSGAQEVPPNPSPATANVTVILNRNTGAVTVTGTFQNLTSNATAAHIHGPAAVGVNAAVLVPLTVPSATSGAVTGTGTMSTGQMDEMLGGMTYVNIHSANYPEGEIRAQITP